MQCSVDASASPYFTPACLRARIGSAERQPHGVFLNPGERVERGTGPYWRMVTQFMQPAARSLGVHLEVLYAERDHVLMLRQAEDVARRSPAPD